MTRHILLIDDNADLREILKLSLELTSDVEVTTASSGRDGIDFARRARPDAILLDVRMPDLDGPQTLRLLREDPRTATIPVVFITASVQRSERAVYEAHGVAAIIEKPFDPVQAGSILFEALGWTDRP